MPKKLPTKPVKEESETPKQPIKPIRYAKSTLTTQSGVPGEMLISSYFNEEMRVDDLSILDYRKMRDNDGQVQMLLNAIVNTILSAGFEIEDDDEWEGEKESEEKEFIEHLFTDPAWKLGMGEPLKFTNRTMLRAIEEGYRTFEVVYRVDPDGKIRLDRLAPRAIRISDNELRLMTDDHGNFIGFHQMSSIASKLVDVRVYNDSPIRKAINVVYGREYGSNYGRPALKPVFYHYDKAHKGMFLNHVAHELGANKFRVVYTQGNTNPETDTQILNILERTGQNSVVIVNELEYRIEFADASSPEAMREGREMIQYHTGQMSKALLAQFIDLGTKTTGTGARSLGEDQIDFFKQGVQTIAEDLIDETWNLVISDLIKINFNRNIYPSYKTNKINDQTIKNLFDVFMKLAEKDALTDSIKAEIIGKTSENLGLDVTTADIITELEEKDAADKEMKQQEQDMAMQKMAMTVKQPPQTKAKLSEDMGVAVEPMRPLYADEQKVKFVDIKYKLDGSFEQAEQILTRKLQVEKDAIINRYIGAMRLGYKSIKNTTVKLAEQETSYSEELVMLALSILEFGKIMAAGEVNVTVPTTTRLILQALRDQVELAVAEQSSNLQFRLQSVANTALVQGIPENQVRLQLEQEFDVFVDRIVSPTVGAIVPKAFNMGRQVTFDKNQTKIFAYRYTAVLDNRTTDYCRSLDGRVLQATDPNYPLITPPNHFNCRSFWTPILVDESNGVRVDGKPFDLPTYSSISTFRDVPEVVLSEKHNHDDVLRSEITSLIAEL